MGNAPITGGEMNSQYVKMILDIVWRTSALACRMPLCRKMAVNKVAPHGRPTATNFPAGARAVSCDCMPLVCGERSSDLPPRRQPQSKRPPVSQLDRFLPAAPVVIVVARYTARWARSQLPQAPLHHQNQTPPAPPPARHAPPAPRFRVRVGGAKRPGTFPPLRW